MAEHRIEDIDVATLLFGALPDAEQLERLKLAAVLEGYSDYFD